MQGNGLYIAEGDRQAQLTGNLISNAITYGAEDRPVTVTSSITALGFELMVYNWGSPIPPDFLATVFSPMTRGVNLLQDTRSVGLGLFIVSEIGKAHGGMVSVTSKIDVGTTFKATFPL